MKNNLLKQKQKEKEFETKLENHMRNIHTDGLKLGANAISTVIMQKVEHCDEKSTREELLECINNVKEFCKVSLGKK